MSRIEVLRLYKELLRLGKKWPGHADRVGRNLGDGIVPTVRQKFKENKGQTDPNVVRMLLADATLEHKLLTEISKKQIFFYVSKITESSSAPF